MHLGPKDSKCGDKVWGELWGRGACRRGEGALKGLRAFSTPSLRLIHHRQIGSSSPSTQFWRPVIIPRHIPEPIPLAVCHARVLSRHRCAARSPMLLRPLTYCMYCMYCLYFTRWATAADSALGDFPNSFLVNTLADAQELQRLARQAGYDR